MLMNFKRKGGERLGDRRETNQAEKEAGTKGTANDLCKSDPVFCPTPRDRMMNCFGFFGRTS